MTTRRYYANSAPQQTLQAGINATATTCTINGSFTGWPTNYPYGAVLDKGTANEEAVLVTAVVGTTATITRGYDGYSGISHLAGATLDQAVLRVDLDDASAHVNATTGVHGVSGAVVGTTDVQTLTNKTLTGATLSSPSISNPNITGTATIAAATVTGALSVGGNATVTGTLASGAQTVTGGIMASGTVQGATVTATGAVNGASAAISGNATVGGSLTTTGVSTAAGFSASGNGTVSGAIVVRQYSNEAAATTAIPSPITGTLVFLTAPTGGADAGLFVWNGSWKRTAPKFVSLTGNATIHAGNSTETVTVSYGDTFAAAPKVLVVDSGSEDFVLSAQSPTTTAFTLRISTAAGGPVNIDHSVPYTCLIVGQQ